MEVFDIRGNFDYRKSFSSLDFLGKVVASEDNDFFKGVIFYPNLNNEPLAICGCSNFRSNNNEFNFHILSMSKHQNYRPSFTTGYVNGSELILTSPYDFTEGFFNNNVERLAIWKGFHSSPKDIRKILRNFNAVVKSGPTLNRKLARNFELKGLDEFTKFYWEKVIKDELKVK